MLQKMRSKPEDATVQEWGVRLLQTLYKQPQGPGPIVLVTKKDILRVAATVIKLHPKKRSHACNTPFSLSGLC